MAITSMTFDETFYLTSNSDVLTAVLNGQFTSAEEHWTNFGFRELRDPNENFDTSFYLINNTDVLSAGVNPLDHFVAFGATENRVPNEALSADNASTSFDEDVYLAANTDVAAAVTAGTFTDGYQHWVLFGQFEGRAAQNTAGTTLSGTNSTAIQTFSLTTAGDAITGTTAADSITGAQGTLGSSDVIDGGLGTDTLEVRLANDLPSSTLAPTISNVESLVLISQAASAGLNFSNISGVTAVSVQGQDIELSALATGQVVQLDGGYSSDLTVDIASSTTAANAFTLDVNSASSAGFISTDVDALTINIDQSSFSLGSASNFTAASSLTITGTGAFTFVANSGVAGGLQGSAILTLTAIDGSSAVGGLTVNIGSAATNALNVTGSTANDTFRFYETFNNADAIAGGAGTDEFQFAVNTAAGLRPVLSDVETITLDVNANLSASLTAAGTSVGTINIRASADVVLSGMASSVTALNIESGLSTAADLTFGYTGSTDVTLNFAGGSSTALETAAQTATAITAGLVNINSNTGAVNVIATGTAGAVTLETLSANAAKTFGLSAACANFTVNSGVGLGTATTVSLVAATGKSITINDDLVAPVADSVTFNAAGASALVDLESAQLDFVDELTITVGSAGTGHVGFSAESITFCASTANENSGSSFDITAINLNALGGDISIGTASFEESAVAAVTAGDAGALNAQVNVTIESTANAVTIDDLVLGEIGTGQLDITVSGSGAFTISSANFDTGALQVVITTTALSTGSTATIDFANVSSAITGGLTVTLGNHGGSVNGASAADTITLGAGGQTAFGNGGEDQITLSTGVDVVGYNSTTTAGVVIQDQDTVFSVATGDIILFRTNNTYANIQTGSLLTSVGTTTAAATSLTAGGILTASFTSIGSGLLADAEAFTGAVGNPFAIFTSNGNTIIQIYTFTAAVDESVGTAMNSAQFAQVTLNGKDFSDLTATFSLETNATLSGLALTVIG